MRINVGLKFLEDEISVLIFLAFIEYVKERVDWTDASENVKIYWEAFISKEEKEKPMFTDNGKLILQFLRDNPDTTTWKARDIAEGLFITSRTVSGAIRKLCTDGFVEKVSQDPVIYTITELGKTVEIN